MYEHRRILGFVGANSWPLDTAMAEDSWDYRRYVARHMARNNPLLAYWRVVVE